MADTEPNLDAVWIELADALLESLTGDATPSGPAAKHLASSRAAFEESLDDDSVFSAIARRAALRVDAAEVLALCAAIELDPARQQFVARIGQDSKRRRTSLYQLQMVLGPDHDGLAALNPSGSLRRAALTHLTGDAPFGDRGVAVAESVLWRLTGSTLEDPYLPTQAEWVPAPDDAPGDHRLLVVTGEDRTRRIQSGILHTAADQFLLVPVPSQTTEWEAVIRQATLDGRGVILDVSDTLPPEARWWIDRARHLAWCITTPTDQPLAVLPRRPWTAMRSPDPRASREEIRRVSDEAHERGHRFTADQLRQLRTLLPATDGDLDEAVRRVGGGALDRLAKRIQPQRQLEDLVLPDHESDQLNALIARYRNAPVVHGEWGVPAYPAGGISALFAGPPGTGKTAAAEAIAGAIGLDLCMIDLSSVVSKYIGETEENLDRVFDAAEAGNIVLLFDEADAVFGKRAEVNDARDRYANMEISYLLQRIERFEGLVILTTNYFGNIDEAFLRRLTVVLTFDMPTVDERRTIWTNYLDTGMPLATGDDAVNVDHLAKRFEISGALILNSCIGGAFIAAEEGGSVTMERVQRALRRELKKMGRLVHDADFLS